MADEWQWQQTRIPSVSVIILIYYTDNTKYDNLMKFADSEFGTVRQTFKGILTCKESNMKQYREALPKAIK